MVAPASRVQFSAPQPAGSMTVQAGTWANQGGTFTATMTS